jgi:amino acid efflux transporter
VVAVLIFSGWALGVPLALAAAAVGVGRRFGGSQEEETTPETAPSVLAEALPDSRTQTAAHP